MAGTLGENHPDVVALKAEVAAGQRFVREVSAEGDRAAIGTLVVDKRSWTLHGFVRDPELQGQPKLTVALYSRAGQWIEVLGHACTDERGYFQLRYPPGAGPGKEGGALPTQRELFIWVSNKQEVLYRDKKPTTAALGEIKYREIILGGESDCCSPPPSEPPSKVPPKEATSIAKPSAKASKTQKARAIKKTPKDKKP